MMAARETDAAVDWAAVAAPIAVVPPWRPAAPAAEPDPHKAGWAGPGFTRPGTESDVGYRFGYALGQAEAFAGMTTIFDGPATSFTDGYINGHRQMTEHLVRAASGGELPKCEAEQGLPRVCSTGHTHAVSRPGRQIDDEGRILNDRQHE
jgi:hypothetical protein